MSCQVLHCFRINTGIDQISNIGMTQQVRSNLKINGIRNFRIISLITQLSRGHRVPDRLSIDIFMELVSDFYREMYGTEISEEEKKIMKEAAKEAGIEDEAY